MSTSGMFSTSEDITSASGDIMMHVGEHGDKILSISIENPDVLNNCCHIQFGTLSHRYQIDKFQKLTV